MTDAQLTQLALVAVAVVAGVPATIAALAAWSANKKAAVVKKKVDEVYVKVDGRLTAVIKQNEALIEEVGELRDVLLKKGEDPPPSAPPSAAPADTRPPHG